MSHPEDTIEPYENNKSPTPGDSKMLRKFSKVLLENSSKRALASLIMTVSVEVATRRDTSATSENRMVLEELLQIHEALSFAWSTMNKFCSPEDYAAAFDSYSATLPKMLKNILDSRVNSYRSGIMSDLEVPLFSSSFQNRSKMEATEKMLVLVAA
jgi:hypothetical protein